MIWPTTPSGSWRIGDRVRVDLRQGAFLSADAAGEIAEMIDGERQVGRGRLTDRFTVVATLDEGQEFLALLHPVGDLVEDTRPVAGAGLAPFVLGGMGGVKRQFDVLSSRAGDFAQRFAVDWAQV